MSPKMILRNFQIYIKDNQSKSDVPALNSQHYIILDVDTYELIWFKHLACLINVKKKSKKMYFLTFVFFSVFCIHQLCSNQILEYFLLLQ